MIIKEENQNLKMTVQPEIRMVIEEENSKT